MERNVKVAIIGAGTAGLSAVSQVSKHTKDFLLVNAGPYGTTCARTGCMPSKVLIDVAHEYHRLHLGEQRGIRGGKNLSIDLPAVMRHVRELRDYWTDGVVRSTLALGDEHNLTGHATFIAPNVLKVDGRHTITAEKIIIATGSTPFVPQAWTDFGSRLVTTDDFFELDDLPESIAVIGMGVIGLELGQALAHLGLNVVGLDLKSTIGGITDPVIARCAHEILEKEFDLWLGDEVEVEDGGSDGLTLHSADRTLTAEKVLVCMGRKPNLAGLGLETIGIPTDERGTPQFDRNSMQIAGHPIFIAGDVNGNRALLHEAADEGRIAGANAVSGQKVRRFKRRAPLSICFSEPNVCFAGRTYAQIQDHEHLAIGEVSFSDQGRAKAMARNQGHLRVYVDRGNGQLLGAEMIAPHGEHLAHLLAWAMQQELSVFETLRLPFYHPTVEEGLRTALRAAAREVPESSDHVEFSECDATCSESLY